MPTYALQPTRFSAFTRPNGPGNRAGKVGFPLDLIRAISPVLSDSLPVSKAQAAALAEKLLVSASTFDTSLLRFGALKGTGSPEIYPDGQILFVTTITGDAKTPKRVPVARILGNGVFLEATGTDGGQRIIPLDSDAEAALLDKVEWLLLAADALQSIAVAHVPQSGPNAGLNGSAIPELVPLFTSNLAVKGSVLPELPFYFEQSVEDKTRLVLALSEAVEVATHI